MDYRTLQPSQRAQLWAGGPDLAQPELLLESTEILFEAPNWSRDGAVLFLNGAGQLWRVDLRRPDLELAAVRPEWSPDGAWIYFNTESFTRTPGHAQLARIPDGGGGMERLVESSSVDWFPHLSPDGRFATYIAFPAGTTGHPPDLDVEVRVVATTDWSTPLQSHQLFGGQGTINVNSWSPDSSRFALVAYPTALT